MWESLSHICISSQFSTLRQCRSSNSVAITRNTRTCLNYAVRYRQSFTRNVSSWSTSTYLTYVMYFVYINPSTAGPIISRGPNLVITMPPHVLELKGVTPLAGTMSTTGLDMVICLKISNIFRGSDKNIQNGCWDSQIARHFKGWFGKIYVSATLSKKRMSFN